MKEEVQYLDIVKNALQMTWKNKSMWFFGFLVFVGSIMINFNNSEIPQPNQFLQPIQAFNQRYPLISAFLVFLLVMIVAALYLLKLIATAALIKMSNNIAVYKQAKIKTIFSESKEYVWQIFAIEMLVGIVALFLATILIVPIAYLYSQNSKSLAFIFLILGFILISVLLTIAFYLIKYGQIFLVLSNIGIKKSLESAYALLEKNLKQSLIFGLISIALNLIFILSLVFIISFLALIALLIGFLLYLLFAKTGVLITVSIMGVASIIAMLTLFSWFNAFMQSAWVLFFQNLSLDKKDEKEKEEEIEASAIIPDPEAV